MDTWKKFKTARPQLQVRKDLRLAEHAFINNILMEGLEKKDTKPFWKFVKARRQDNTGVSPLKAQILSDQFQSFFTQDDGKRPTLAGTSYPSMPEISIHVASIEKMLRQLKPTKSSRPDALPNRVLRELAPELSPVLTTIFQQSLDTRELPEDWRKANIAPIFKKGDRHLASNYRPVSLTCVCCQGRQTTRDRAKTSGEICQQGLPPAQQRHSHAGRAGLGLPQWKSAEPAPDCPC